MKKILLFFLLLIPSSIAAQYQYSYFQDPQQQWQQSNVNINETTIEIHPKGNFAEVELFVSFSAVSPGQFDESDQIELVEYFNLPEDVAVSDLWLWFGDEILKAHILNRWSAGRIYEDIVDRRQDPAILYKNSESAYELRVYPFKPDQERKIKISFLLPVDITGNSSTIRIPTPFHPLASDILEDATIRYWSEKDSPELSVTGQKELNFEALDDSTGAQYWEAVIEKDSVQNGFINFSETSQNTSTYLGISENDGEKFYSLSFIPSEIIDLGVTKEVAIILDFTASNTSLLKTDFFDLAEETTGSNFRETDNFTVIYSDLSAKSASDTWVTASNENISNIFNSIDLSEVSSISNLNGLLAKGIDFIEENGGTGELLLITSSDSYWEFEDANALSETIFNYGSEGTPKITIIDVQDNSIPYNYGNGKEFRGNEYLYNILSKETGGELYNYGDSNNLIELISMGFQSLEGVIENFDLQINFESGFTYNRFSNSSEVKLPLNAVFTQTGKYYGELPLTINFKGSFADSIITQNVEVSDSDTLGSSLKRYWTSRKIHQMENDSPSNEEIATIIDYSVDNRIMSRYTSFLALEPQDTSRINQETNGDGGTIISIEDEIDDDPESFNVDSLYAYPNPFNPTVNIQVELSQFWNSSNSSITIYNMLGQEVATLNTSSFDGQKSFTVQWNTQGGINRIATGIYIVRVQTPWTVKTIKITFLK